MLASSLQAHHRCVSESSAQLLGCRAGMQSLALMHMCHLAAVSLEHEKDVSS